VGSAGIDHTRAEAIAAARRPRESRDETLNDQLSELNGLRKDRFGCTLDARKPKGQEAEAKHDVHAMHADKKMRAPGTKFGRAQFTCYARAPGGPGNPWPGAFADSGYADPPQTESDKNISGAIHCHAYEKCGVIFDNGIECRWSD
jgi:hypothetical protein